jgi:hypothetical protein
MKKIFFLLLSFIAISCSKDNATETPADQLPPITQTGANTAGCIINGKVLIPKNGSQAIGGSTLYGLTIGGGIHFNAPIIGDDYFYVSIQNLKDSILISQYLLVYHLEYIHHILFHLRDLDDIYLQIIRPHLLRLSEVGDL